MRKHLSTLLAIAGLCLSCPVGSYGASPPSDIQVLGPGGLLRIQVRIDRGALRFAVDFKNQAVLEGSPMHFLVDGVDLADGVEVMETQGYQVQETYPWRGVHSQAMNHCNGVRSVLRHRASDTRFTLESRAYDDGVAFRFLVADQQKPRVPDEGTTFVLPAGCTVWCHNLEGHYEGVHAKKDVAQLKAGEWIAPPLTFQLPGALGYGSITEAALVNYSGMALQADGKRGLCGRLGHAHPPSYPYRLRYSADDIARLSKPATIVGPITTPWRVVLFGPDLNTLVNSDIVTNLCPPPDPTLFPQGLKTDWIKPGRAVWKYLDGGQNTFQAMKDFTRLAGELGFEHHIIEGFWTRWSDAQIKELVQEGNKYHVGIWLWKHSKTLREPSERHAFLKRCHDLGIAGVKVDFFDHEAKEVIDLYQALLREGAQYKLLMDFHGANKPTGESRTWPNELTREAIKGMEASKLQDRATHDVTLPFMRLLAGPGEYTPVHFGDRRKNTTWAHQVASAAIFSAPLLTYAANPTNILANPCCDMIKSIPSTWDETVVLPASRIGEIAVYARRVGPNWFLAIMNGPSSRNIDVPLSFLGPGLHQAMLIADDPANAAAVKIKQTTLKRDESLSISLSPGGGFVGRFGLE